MKFAQADKIGGTWVLGVNPIWTPPLKGGKVNFRLPYSHDRPNPGPRRLVIDKEGRVYGVRTCYTALSTKKGRVSIGGKARPCTRSLSKFRRALDGAVCKVPTLVLDDIPTEFLQK